MIGARILLVGRSDSSHALRWRDLCTGMGMEVRLHEPEGRRDALRGVGVGTPSGLCPTASRDREFAISQFQAEVKRFRPAVVQVMGLDPYAFIAFDALEQTSTRPRCVIQVRGGPDLMLSVFAPELRRKIEFCLRACDGVLADHAGNLDLCRRLGLGAEAIARDIGPVPGGGGLNTQELELYTAPMGNPSIILWPKAYVTPSVDGFAVAEGLRRLHAARNDFRLRLLFAVQEDFLLWLQGYLPPDLLENTTIRPRVTHIEALDEIAAADILLAPSLLDGIPNVLLEALALGTLPLVSDLGHRSHCLAPWIAEAANLDPQAIAVHLDQLLSLSIAQRVRMAEENRAAIRGYVDRASIVHRLQSFYAGLTKVA